MPDIQTQMQKLLNAMVSEGRERGIQLTAYHHGRVVVDAWAGVTDVATGRPVDGATLFPVFSVGKGLVATIVHRLVERKQLSYDTPIAALWPEFAAGDKAAITVRHALNHTAGMQNMPLGIGYREMCDWDLMCDAIAKLSPVTEPGSAIVYHPITYGWLLGEVIRRVTGLPFQQALKKEICEPLGVTDLYTGLPDERQREVAVLEEIFEPEPAPRVDDSVPQGIPGWMMPLHTMMNRADARRACIPASNGIATARALAKHYAALLPGGVDGVELLPPHRVQIATQLEIAGRAADAPRIALGYFLIGPPRETMHRANAFGHSGYGGAIGFADPENELAVGLTKNLYSKNAGHDQVVNELRKALGIND